MNTTETQSGQFAEARGSAALVQIWNERAKEMRAHAENDQAWQPQRAGRYIARAEMLELCAKELQARVPPNGELSDRTPKINNYRTAT